MSPQPDQILDPQNTAKVTREYFPTKPLPKEVRNFGYVPEISKLLPGDLLLVSAKNPSYGSRAIIQAQTDGGYHPEDACWHHAAVYIGDDLICEAQLWQGVRITSLYDYVGKHRLRFRRDTALTNDDCWKLVVNCLGHLNESYSFSALIRLWHQSRVGFWRPDIRLNHVRAMVCSELYSVAYVMTTKRLLVEDSMNITTPAGLSLCPRLTDVSIDWLQIGRVPTVTA